MSAQTEMEQARKQALNPNQPLPDKLKAELAAMPPDTPADIRAAQQTRIAQAERGEKPQTLEYLTQQAQFQAAKAAREAASRPKPTGPVENPPTPITEQVMGRPVEPITEQVAGPPKTPMTEAKPGGPKVTTHAEPVPGGETVYFVNDEPVTREVYESAIYQNDLNRQYAAAQKSAASKLRPYMASFGGPAYETPGGYDIAKYLRDNDNSRAAQTELKAAGFSPKAIESAVEYNNRPYVATAPIEKVYRAIEESGKSVEKLKSNYPEFQKYLTDNGLLEDYRHAIGADRGTRESKIKYEKPEMGIQEFTENFITARYGNQKISQMRRNSLVDMAQVEYSRRYGPDATTLSLQGMGLKQGAALVPVVGTVLYWNEMSTPWRVASIALDVVAVGGLVGGVIPKGAVGRAVGRVVKMPGLQAAQDATRAEIKATTKTLAEVDRPLAKSFSGLHDSMNSYTKAAVEAKNNDKLIRDLEKTLKTTFGEVRPEVEHSLELAQARVGPLREEVELTRQRLIRAGESFSRRQAEVQQTIERRVTQAYGYDYGQGPKVNQGKPIARTFGYDTPALKQEAKDIGKVLSKRIDVVAERAVNPPQKSLNKLTKALRAAEADGDPAEIARIKENIALVKSEKARGIAYDLKRYTEKARALKAGAEETARLRAEAEAELKAARDYVAKVKNSGDAQAISRAGEDLIAAEERLDAIIEQQKTARELSEKLTDYLQQYDRQWAEEFTGGGGGGRVFNPATRPFTLISPSGVKVSVGASRFVGGGLSGGGARTGAGGERGATSRQRFPMTLPIDPAERLVWVFPQPTTPGIAPGRVAEPDIKSFPLGSVKTITKPRVLPLIEPTPIVTPGTVPVVVPQPKPLVSPEIRPDISTDTRTQAKTQTQTETKTQKQTATQTKTDTKTQTQTQARAGVTVGSKPGGGVETETAPETKPIFGIKTKTQTTTQYDKKATRKIPIVIPPSSDKEKREYVRGLPGAATYNMGKLEIGGKLLDIWWVKIPGHKEPVVIKGNAPEGVRILADGKGSAKKTAQVLGRGRTFAPFTQRHGAVTARMKPARTSTGAEVSFSPYKSVKVDGVYYTNLHGHIGMSRRPVGKRSTKTVRR